MTIEAVLFDALKGLVANRVYPLTFPQSTAAPVWPAIRYQFVSETPVLDISGDDDEQTDEVRVQIDVVAETYAQMRSLQRQVRHAMAALDPPWTCELMLDEFDADTKTRRAIMDFLFHGSTESGNSPP